MKRSLLSLLSVLVPLGGDNTPGRFATANPAADANAPVPTGDIIVQLPETTTP